jgi:hypothetical protein
VQNLLIYIKTKTLVNTSKTPLLLLIGNSHSLSRSLFRCTDLGGRPDSVMAGVPVKSHGRPRYPSSHDTPERAHEAARQLEEAAADATVGIAVFVDEDPLLGPQAPRPLGRNAAV